MAFELTRRYGPSHVVWSQLLLPPGVRQRAERKARLAPPLPLTHGVSSSDHQPELSGRDVPIARQRARGELPPGVRGERVTRCEYGSARS
jgi:hypothetical protein